MSAKTDPFDLVGKKYLIRTVTYFYLGEIVAADNNLLEMNTCSWVADTGRYGETIEKGSLNNSEFLGDGIIVNRGSIVEMVPWRHNLPTESI